MLDRNKFEIHAVTTREISADDSRSCWHTVDLHSPRHRAEIISRIRPEILVHLAWYTEHGQYWSSPLNLQWVETSSAMLRDFSDAGGRRAVFLGTCAEYDWNYGFCTEDLTPRRPASLYGVAKNALFEMAQKFAETKDFEFVWGRVFFPYGPGEAQSRFVSSIITAIRDGRDAHCSHGEQMRDFVYVKDLAGAIAALISNNVRGAVNLGSGIPVKLKELALRIGDMMQNPGKIRLGAIPAQENDPPLVLADISRLKSTASWHPEYSMEAGLRETIDYWLNMAEA